MKYALPLLLLLSACGKDAAPADRLIDTGWFTDTGLFDAASCKDRVTGTLPDTGTSDWYYRDNVEVYVGREGAESYAIRLLDTAGVPVPMTPVWSEEGLRAVLELDGPLKPNTDYELHTTDCAETSISSFRTSSFGEPLNISEADLIGKTWHLDLLGANWIEPGGVTSLLQLYFTTPTLFGVRYANGDIIDFIGAPGDVDLLGQIIQAAGPIWDFPTTDFSNSPYFDASTDLLVFGYNGVEVPVNNFRLTATISADGRRLGGGSLSGLADTRDLGVLLGGGFADDPNAICDIAGGMGVDCSDCPDGEPYCLFMHATDIEATVIDGLTLLPSN
ncbi:MAG: hypothetical protein GWP91_05030 [Rhodobacterales bacterium]|nr:hypothetical protein [Rhodobacterales bacterium]